MEITIRLRHPGRDLSPNAHVPMTRRGAIVANAKKLEAKKGLRTRAYILAENELEKHDAAAFRPCTYSVRWLYKGSKPDADNCLARCKAAIDGACLAFNIDDGELDLAGIERVHTLDGKAGFVELTFADGKEEA